MTRKIDKAFLVNYFEGRATALQKQQIDRWIKIAANKELFYKCLHEWELANIQCDTDQERAFQVHTLRVNHLEVNQQEDIDSERESESDSLISSFNSYVRIAKIAASLIIALASSLFFYWQKDFILYSTYAADSERTENITLSDGSHVALFSGATLKVPRFNFKTGHRKVSLTGSASFNVKRKDTGQKFIVQTATGVEIIVLGTIFNVYADTYQTKVTLDEGSVQLQYKEGQVQKQLLMVPGEIATVSEDEPIIVKKVFEEIEEVEGEEKKIVFEQATLGQVISILNTTYGFSINLEDQELAQQTISGTFPAKDVHELVDLLMEGAGLKLYTSEQGDIIVSAP